MRILQFQAVGGASGDMILAALLDLGVPADWLREQLAVLALEPFELRAVKMRSHGLEGTRVDVVVGGEQIKHRTSNIEHPTSNAEPPTSGFHPDTPSLHHSISPQPAPAGHHPHHGPSAHGRSFKDIRELIARSRLPEDVRLLATRVFQRLAEAEGRIHGQLVDEVHFHEIGALDSIVDIIGACLALRHLRVDVVRVDPLPLGCGTIVCAHGVYPLPAPATVELLKGFPVVQTGEPHETVTPTGAALLMEWRRGAEDLPPEGALCQAGVGFGHKDMGARPNILRALILESTAPAGTGTATDVCTVLECNLDDVTPELMGVLTQRLMEAGALDAFVTPVQMKKQRPGVLVTVLCRAGQRAAMLDLLFREGTTFGVREHQVQRTVLERRWEEVLTPYGRVRIKIGRWRGADVTRAPELDDCIAVAGAAGVPVRTVYEAARAAAG